MIKKSALTAILIFALYLIAFYPGYMSKDSAYHYSQIMSEEWTNFQPVIILVFWQFTDNILKGPGGLFILFIATYVFSLWLISRYIKVSNRAKWYIVLIALMPVNIMLLPHIWKDIGLLIFSLLSVGLICVYLSLRVQWILLLSLASLWLAVLFRFEAILYLWPLVFIQAKLALSSNSSLSKKVWYGLLSVAMFALLTSLSNKALIKLTDTKKVTLWPTIALWDMARVSVLENKLIMPDFTVGLYMNVADLAQATRVWSNTSLYEETKAGVNRGLKIPYTKAQYDTLLKTWMRLPIEHTRAYFSHRWQLLNELLRIREQDNKPIDLYWSRGIIQYDDLFKLNNGLLNHYLTVTLKTLKDWFIMKPWFYVLVGVFALFAIMKRREFTASDALAVSLIVSSFLSIGVLFFLAPAAEQRYLIILFNFIPIASIYALGSRHREKTVNLIH